jgi:glycosyltransferase involved in cell wall biosynthesis
MIKKKIAILLPYKEDFNEKNASAASLWVKDFTKISKFKKITQIFGVNSENIPLLNNFTNIKMTNNFFTKKNIFFCRKVIDQISKYNFKIIEIHNRPEIFNYLKKNYPNYKYILVFHNDPDTLRGSKTPNERKYILKNCDKIIFVSQWVKKSFFINLNQLFDNKCFVIYPAIKKNKFFAKKSKIITFIGKLNSSKGYNLFLPAIIRILDKHKDWRCIIAGNEKREKYNLSHERITFYDWLSHKKIIKIYKKSSISVVPSQWNEPFGRTAMESSNLGNATIISSKGGLKETSRYPIILKCLSINEIYKNIDNLIVNKKKLIQLQKRSFAEPLVDLNEQSVTNDLLKETLLYYDDINFKTKNKNRTIIHIGNTGLKNGYRLNNISIFNKISNGLIKLGHNVININDRIEKNINYQTKFEKQLINICNNINPDLILLGHSNFISNETLSKVKKLNTKISLWYEDPLFNGGPDYVKNITTLERNNDLIDKYFITVSPEKINTNIKKSKLHFLPIPFDNSIERFNFYKNINSKPYDIFFAMSHGVNRGTLKKNKTDGRENIIYKLFENQNIIPKLYGIQNQQPVWGNEFIKSLKECKMALNLSRGNPTKYYSSNRIASLIGNGVPTLVSIKTKLNDFFSNDEVIFYKDEKDLINKILYFKNNIKKLTLIGKKGKSKYSKIFNNVSIADYIISTSLNQKPKFKYHWLKMKKK